MPIPRSDALSGGSIAGACRADGTRSDAGGDCGCGCCGSGNQCLLLPGHGGAWLEGHPPGEILALSAGIPPAGFDGGFSKLGAAFDVVSELGFTETVNATTYDGFHSYPDSPVDRDRTRSLALSTHRVRYRLVPATLTLEEANDLLGPFSGDGWVPVFSLVDHATGAPSTTYYADAEPLAGSWTDSDDPAASGSIGPAMPPELEAMLPVTLGGLSRLLVRQDNRLGQVNPGRCDGLAWNPIGYFDSILRLGFADASPTPEGGLFNHLNTLADDLGSGFAYWDDPVNHFPGIDDQGTPLPDELSGPARLDLARRGGSFAASPLLVFLDFQPPDGPAVVDFTETIPRSIGAAVNVSHATEGSTLSVSASVNGPEHVVDNQYTRDAWGPIVHALSLEVTTRVERIAPCASDEALPPLTCADGELAARAAYPCSPNNGGPAIGYDPAIITPGTETLLHNERLYVPTDVPTTRPIVDAEPTASTCATVNRLARPCDGDGDPVVYDPALRPPDAATCTLGEKRYILTDEPTNLPADTVVFSPVTCGDWFRAVRCPGKPINAFFPAEVSYRAGGATFPGGRPGQGGVVLVNSYQVALPDGGFRVCSKVGQYLPTAEPIDEIPLPDNAHTAHIPRRCGPDYDSCYELDDDDEIGNPRGGTPPDQPPLQDPLAAERVREQMRRYAGDCCG
jgi:hypothetical protein